MAKEKSGAAITASAIRKRLKSEFPEVKFSVQSSVYSTHDSITVYWTDGPIDSIVDEVLREYQQGFFDGMTDSYTFTGIDSSLGCPGVDYVFSSRTFSPERIQALADYVRQNFTEIPDTWKDVYQETGIDPFRVERHNPETWSELNRRRYEAMQQRREEASIEQQREEWNRLKAYEESRKAAAEWSAGHGEVQGNHPIDEPESGDTPEAAPFQGTEETRMDNENPANSPAYPLYPINEAAAKLAQTMNNYNSYVPGSATAEYESMVAKAAELAEQCKALRPEDSEKIDARLDRYSRQLAAWYNRNFQIESYCPSWLVAGGSGLSSRKKERQNTMRDNHMKEWERVQSILNGLRPTAEHSILADDPAAREKLHSKLKALRDGQELMKRVNAYYRKFGTCVGCEGLSEDTARQLDEDVKRGYSWANQPFAPSALTNNNANIKRVEQRIRDLERMSGKQEDGWKFKGGHVEMNAEIMRVQIFFDAIPDVELRSEMKKNGFRWAPSQKAWQRQLTDNGIRAARNIPALAPIEEMEQPAEKPPALDNADEMIRQAMTITADYEKRMAAGETMPLGYSVDTDGTIRTMGLHEEHIIPSEEAAPVVGTIFYYDSGETVAYNTEAEYLDAIRDNYDTLGINGWRYTTVADNPRLRRMATEIERGEYGLEPVSEERQDELRVMFSSGETLDIDNGQLTEKEKSLVQLWKSEAESRAASAVEEEKRQDMISEVPESRYPDLWRAWKQEAAPEWRESLSNNEAALIEEWDRYQPDYMPAVAPEILSEQLAAGCSQQEADQYGLRFYRAATDIPIEISVTRDSTSHKSQIPANSVFATDVYGAFVSMNAPSRDFEGQEIGSETGQHIYLPKSWREDVRPATLDDYIAGYETAPEVKQQDTEVAAKPATRPLSPEEIDRQYNQGLEQLQREYNRGLQQLIDTAVSGYLEKIQEANATGQKTDIGSYLHKIFQLKKWGRIEEPQKKEKTRDAGRDIELD